MFTNAIVRNPCPNMVLGITEAQLGKPDYHKAMLQHTRYVDVLREIGLDVKILEADNRFPDSVFLEDVAVCTPKCAIISRPGAASRRDESEGIKQILRAYFNQVEEIKAPGTLDGGDVMMAGSHYYIGLSGRTNEKGANQFIEILERHQLSGSKISLKETLHLKTGISYLENNNLLVSGEYAEKEEFNSFNKFYVHPDEAYATNSVWINGVVLMPAGYPNTKKMITEAGYHVKEIEMTEFEKLDGGVSCLSLRF